MRIGFVRHLFAAKTASRFRQSVNFVQTKADTTTNLEVLTINYASGRERLLCFANKPKNIILKKVVPATESQNVHFTSYCLKYTMTWDIEIYKVTSVSRKNVFS